MYVNIVQFHVHDDDDAHFYPPTTNSNKRGSRKGNSFLPAPCKKNKRKNKERQKTDQSFYTSNPKRRCLLCFLFVCLLRGMKKISSPLLLLLQCHFSSVYCQFLSKQKKTHLASEGGDIFSTYFSAAAVAGGVASFSCCRRRRTQIEPPHLQEAAAALSPL